MLLCIAALRCSPRPTLFPYTTLFRSNSFTGGVRLYRGTIDTGPSGSLGQIGANNTGTVLVKNSQLNAANRDRKSTRLNSSHVESSYAVFCLKKKMNLELIPKAADSS